jgi:hypothetical protein
MKHTELDIVVELDAMEWRGACQFSSVARTSAMASDDWIILLVAP